MQNIYVNLFGTITVSCDGRSWETLESKAKTPVGKKQLAFLVYLLLNHKRRIPFSELMECFWGSGAKSPENSLKNMMFKTRALLKSVFPEIIDPILTMSDCYEWNSSVAIVLDVETFEQLYRCAKQKELGDALEHQLQAFDLYTGDIPATIDADWIRQLSTYYRMLYVDISRALALQLLEACNWDEVIRVCTQAYAVEPEVEEFTCCAIHAMTAKGATSKAAEWYENYREHLWREFQLVPSEAVEQAYALAMHSSEDADALGETIISQMCEPTKQREAFQCSMIVFRNIIQLELRHMARSKRPASLAVLQVNVPDGTEEVSATDIRRAERVLMNGLRTGDPFTRLNRGRFLVLLPGADEGNAEKVMQRLRSGFHDMFPRSKAMLSYRIYPLSAGTEEVQEK